MYFENIFEIITNYSILFFSKYLEHSNIQFSIARGKDTVIYEKYTNDFLLCQIFFSNIILL